MKNQDDFLIVSLIKDYQNYVVNRLIIIVLHVVQTRLSSIVLQGEQLFSCLFCGLALSKPVRDKTISSYSANPRCTG